MFMKSMNPLLAEVKKTIIIKERLKEFLSFLPTRKREMKMGTMLAHEDNAKFTSTWLSSSYKMPIQCNH